MTNQPPEHAEGAAGEQWPDNMPLAEQVERLAQFIITTYQGEPSQSGGAIETALRLMKRDHNATAALEAMQADRDEWRELCFAKIERGNTATAALAEAEKGLRVIEGADAWRIVSGSIGPLMDHGYAMACKSLASHAHETLARIEAAKAAEGTEG